MRLSRPNLPFWYGVAAIAVVVPAVFWFRFGDLRFGVAVAGFLLLLVLAVQFLPELDRKYGAEQAALKVKPRVFDRLGVVWLLAVPFAPFLAWAIGSLATVNLRTWRWVLGAEAFLCVAVPLTCVLPLLRYVRGRAAPYSLLVLFLGTLFPVSIGWSSAADFVRGPQWEQVDVASSTRVHLTVRDRDVRTRTLKVRLADGRVLEADAEQLAVRTGACRLLVLRSSRRILAVERSGSSLSTPADISAGRPSAGISPGPVAACRGLWRAGAA
jgi:hypothetical protein